MYTLKKAFKTFFEFIRMLLHSEDAKNKIKAIKMNNYFKKDELECPCCKSYNIKDDFLEKLNKAREIANVPFHINSGYRCLDHNKKIGGSEKSAHTTGNAADIKIISSWHRFKILTSLIEAGFKRIGIYQTFIHADNDESKHQEMIWYS